MTSHQLIEEPRPNGQLGRGVAIIPEGREWDAFVRDCADARLPRTYEHYMFWKSHGFLPWPGDVSRRT